MHRLMFLNNDFTKTRKIHTLLAGTCKSLGHIPVGTVAHEYLAPGRLSSAVGTPTVLACIIYDR